MEDIKELINAVQVIIPVAGACKIIKIIADSSSDEDKSPMTKRIKRVIAVIILAETVITFGTLIKGYYGM